MDPLVPIPPIRSNILPPAPPVQRINRDQQRQDARDQDQGEHEAEEESFEQMLDGSDAELVTLSEPHAPADEAAEAEQWDATLDGERRDDDDEHPGPHIDIIA
ncbi:MAG TPA: hypothetical protein VME01_03220 [Solirubrobacteraceae bacterium]|nr:hypothetical protein [Solirubrobacteraceae bacterium]